MFPLTSVNNIRLSQGISESPKNGEASRSVRRRQSVNVLIKFFQMKKQIHVVSNPERGGWDAKRPNADRSSRHFDTKNEALEWSKNLAKKEGLELIPHGRDGKIQNPNSYGNDPCPPKDTRH